jgi:CDP-diglyceride synthetase
MKKETRDRLMFGLPMGFGGAALACSSLRFLMAFTFIGISLVELSQLNEGFLRSFPWKHKATFAYLDFARQISMYIQLTCMFIHLFLPWSWIIAATSVYAIFILLVPVVILMLFTKIHLNGKTEIDDETTEISRACYIKMALDTFAFLWTMFAYNSLFSMLTHQPYSVMFFGCTVGIVSPTESTALIAGRMFGKHNFSYFISPKKTWEGFAGQFLGIFLSLFTMYTLVFIFRFDNAGLTPYHFVVIGLWIIVVSILGDLMESIIKRACQVKDSSSIGIVGKLGGILDKFDSFGVAWMVMAVALRYYKPETLPY